MKSRLGVLLISDIKNYSNNASNLLSGFLFNRGLWVITACRFRTRLTTKPKSNFILNTLIKIFNHLLRYIIVIFAKTEWHSTLELESKLYLSNRGRMVIGARKIGRGSVLQHDTTIGTNPLADGKGNRPIIGRNVWIGANSIIYGKIKIGNGVTVCENTVISKSIPDNYVLKGNPARVIKKNFDNQQLRMNPESHSSQYL